MTCFYCQKALEWSESFDSSPEKASKLVATMDHLKPRVDGGGDTINNLILCCRPCHDERHYGRSKQHG